MLHSVKTGIEGQKQHCGLILSLADQPGLILSLAAWLEDSEPRRTTSG